VGHIFVAPPDRHLVIAGNTLRITRGPRENGHRPSIDVLFRTAARAYHERAIGVVLSGADDDGTEGLLMIKAHGGRALAQDPSEAVFDRMPRSAVDHVPLDAVLPVAALAVQIARVSQMIVTELGVGETAMNAQPNPEQEIERIDAAIDAWEHGESMTTASGFTCPSCGGGIWQGLEGPLLRFRCHTGHVFSADAFANEQGEVLETTLWQAVRVLSERVALFRQFATRQLPSSVAGMSERYAEQADELERGVTLLRDLLQRNGFWPRPPDV
jgi:two-component system chemotaxis response regulator CheB